MALHELRRDDEATDEPLLSWQGVEKSYGEHKVLKGVSLDVCAGQVLGLLGPNGAGKTTLLAIGSGLETPDRGHTEWRTGSPPALMPQELGLYPVLTARENLVFLARAFGMAGADLAARVGTLLEATGLDRFADARTSTLSGGMKRRLSFAGALVSKPRVLMLDEPTVGVDPQSRLALLELVRSAADDGCAVVYSSHYMEEIQAHADRVAILDHGRILTVGTVAEIVARHGRPLVELEFLGVAAEELTATLLATPGVDVVERVGDGDLPVRLRLHVANRAEGLQAALAVALDAGAQVVDLRLREPTLEAAFIALTGRELRDR